MQGLRGRGLSVLLVLGGAACGNDDGGSSAAAESVDCWGLPISECVDHSTQCRVIEGTVHDVPSCTERTKCTPFEEEILEFVAANKACVSDEDCRVVRLLCVQQREYCNGQHYVRVDHDAAELATLLDRLETCLDNPGCGGCGDPSPPAVCLQGRCSPDVTPR